MALVPFESLRENDEFVADLARYAESILTEKQVRQKYKSDEQVWEQIAIDELMCEMIEAEKVRRIRNGAAKREKAQLHVVAAPDVLSGILKDPKANPRHRIDSAKALDSLAGFSPEVARNEDRVIIRIDLGADTRAKGLEPDPADVLVFEATVPQKPDPNLNDVTPQTPLIEAAEQFDQEEVVPVRRKPGRPKGSRNKPKLIEHDSSPPRVPGFDV